MEPGILTGICEAFRNALLPLAPQFVDLLHPTWFAFVKLAFLLLVLAAVAGAPSGLVGSLLIGTLALGFTHILLLLGYQWTESFFRGTVGLARSLGAPAPDPSGLVSWGWTVADPIFKALDTQGVLSYIKNPFMHLTFEAGAWAIAGAFIVLAAMEMGFLLMSYVLVGTAPFFCLFAVIPVLRSLTMRWATLVFSTMSGLFVTMFLALGVQNIGHGLLETLQAKFLVTGVTLVLADYVMPLGIGVVLIISFTWIPLRFAREANGAAMDIMSGVGAMAMGAWSAATGVARDVGSGGGGGEKTGGGGGGSSSSGNSGSNSSGSMGAAQGSPSSQWSGQYGNAASSHGDGKAAMNTARGHTPY